MVDTGRITRTGPLSGALDPVTGLRIPAVPVVVYEGKCFVDELRIQNPSPAAVAGDFPVSMVATLKLPAMGEQVLVQDLFVLTSAPDHPQDVGRHYRISSFNPKTQAKARLFQMQAVIG